MPYTLSVNGEIRSVDDDGQTPLLWVLRDTLKLTGAKYGCGIAQCGACTVHVDGQPMRACSVPLERVLASKITTIEGVAGPEPDALREAWVARDVPQCGFCQPGQIMSATVLLRANASPTNADIDTAMSGNICRCGTYPRIRGAIHAAAGALRGGSET